MTNGSLNSYRFSFWLPLFAVLLILIPISIWSGLIILAKISGISVLLFLLVALRQWFAIARSSNERVERIQLTTNDIYLLQQLVPSYKRWSNTDQRVFSDQIGLFLAEVQFKGHWESKDQFSVAIATTLATWDIGYVSKQNWVLCVQPDAFVYFEQHPESKIQIPTFPLVGATLTEVLQHEAVIAFKKVLPDF
jgi:hypothetical protein